MFGAKQTLKAITCLITLTAYYASAGGGGGTPPPPKLDCNSVQIGSVNLSPSNPLLEEYRPSVDLKNGINNVFYSIQEAETSTVTTVENGVQVEKQSRRFPKYAWFPRHDGFDVTTVFQRMDYFDVCGNYCGSCCTPVTFAQERTKFVLVKKWVRWEELCEELQHPDNGPQVEQKILEQIQSGNLYGLLRQKGLPNDLAFLDKYTPYVHSNSEIPNEDWMSIYDENGNPVVKRSSPRSYTPIDEGLASSPFLPSDLQPRNSDMVPPPNTSQYPLPDLNSPPPSQSQSNSQVPAPSKELPPSEQLPLTEPIVPPPTQYTPPPQPSTPPAPATSTKPSASSKQTTPQPTNTSVTQSDDLPVAQKIPGKPGFVYSPYVGNGSTQPVDVTGLKSGQKVKDPYSEKIFIVP